jgi:hypothetical protein
LLGVELRPLNAAIRALGVPYHALTDPEGIAQQFRAFVAERTGSILDALRAAFLADFRAGRPLDRYVAELTLRERNELLLAAGFAPAFPESPLDDEALRPVRQAIDTILDGHLPYPAIVVRSPCLLVAANRAFDLFIEGVDPALLEPPINLFRHALHPDGLAPRVRNPARVGPAHHPARAGATRAQPHPSLEALLAELEGYLPPVPDEVDVLFAVPLELASADGDLRLITTLTSFATAADVTLAELSLEAFLPADEHTADVLRRRWG